MRALFRLWGCALVRVLRVCELGEKRSNNFVIQRIASVSSLKFLPPTLSTCSHYITSHTPFYGKDHLGDQRRMSDYSSTAKSKRKNITALKQKMTDSQSNQRQLARRDLTTIFSGEETSFHSSEANILMGASSLRSTEYEFGPSSSESDEYDDDDDADKSLRSKSTMRSEVSGDEESQTEGSQEEEDVTTVGEMDKGDYRRYTIRPRTRGNTRQSRNYASSVGSASSGWIDETDSSSVGSIQAQSVEYDVEDQSYDSLNSERLEELKRKCSARSPLQGKITPISEGDESKRSSITYSGSALSASLPVRSKADDEKTEQYTVQGTAITAAAHGIETVADASYSNSSKEQPCKVYTDEKLKNVEYARLEVASNKDMSTVELLSKREALRAFTRQEVPTGFKKVNVPTLIPVDAMNDDVSSIGGGRSLKPINDDVSHSGDQYGVGRATEGAASRIRSPSFGFRVIEPPHASKPSTTVQYLETEEPPPPRMFLRPVSEESSVDQPDPVRTAAHGYVCKNGAGWCQRRSELELFLIGVISISIVVLIVMITILVKRTS